MKQRLIDIKFPIDVALFSILIILIIMVIG